MLQPKRKKRPTQADVARLAEVSQATVSQVLNASTTSAVPETTRNRILAAARSLGYAPHHAARSLRTQRTHAIAAIIPDITNPFYPAFARGIQDAAEARGYDLVVYNTDGDAERERKYLLSAQHGRVDGVISVLFNPMIAELAGLLDTGVGVVLLRPEASPPGDLPIDCIYVNNAAAAHAVVAHLIERGHRRIAMLSGQSGPHDLRIRGYRDALAEHGLPFDPGLLRESGYTEVGGYHGMQALLQAGEPFTAVFAANDLMAIGALLAIQESGRRAPDDIAVAGLDDIPAARLVTPPLTTITQFQDQLGRRAADLLIDRLTGQAPEQPRCEEMPFQLIVRRSS